MAFWTWFAGVECQVAVLSRDFELWQSCVLERTAVRWLRHNRFWLQGRSHGQCLHVRRESLDLYRKQQHIQNSWLHMSIIKLLGGNLSWWSQWVHRCLHILQTGIDGSFEPTTSVYCHRGRPVFVPDVQVRCAHKVVQIKPPVVLINNYDTDSGTDY